MWVNRPVTRRILFGLLLVIVVPITVMTLAGHFLAGPAESIPVLINNPQTNQGYIPETDPGKIHLRVMTLNLSHGRGSGTFSFLASEQQTRKNLKSAAQLIRSVNPHIVALQEVDELSFMSGGFNHARQLMLDAGLSWGIIGRHVKMNGLTYGTGLVSLTPMKGIHSRTFESTPPTLTKGFVVATVSWPGNSLVRVDVVSVHLDFLSAGNRKRQVADLENFIYRRGNPLIVMGDLNSTWDEPDSAVQHLAHRLNLNGYKAASDFAATFPATGKRIDWILISSNLAFKNYRVLPDSVSDHLAVAADICLVR